MAKGSESTSHWFNTAALALAIDLLIVFPISHGSMIGHAITSFSSSIVVPPLDSLATGVFGMESGATQVSEMANLTSSYSGATTAAAPVATAAPTAPPPPAPPPSNAVIMDAAPGDAW